MSNATSTMALRARIDELELVEGWYDDDPSTRVRFGSAFDASTGAAASSTFYLEVPAGHRTPWHTHSAEEVVYVVKGQAQAGIADERVDLSAGDVALIPAHVPHGLENTGDEPLGFIAFFAAAAMVHVFDQTLQPFGGVFVTPPPELLPIPNRT
jgi:quercetin dioxygenase-like cupin family protein